MKFGKAQSLTLEEAQTFDGQPGQWVSVNGRKGRFIGRTEGKAWFLWKTPHRSEMVHAMREIVLRLQSRRVQPPGEPASNTGIQSL